MNNGVGLRNVLWLSRCSHCCDGCFQPESWKNTGTVVTEAFIQQMILDLDKHYIKGLTLTGGDPLHRANYQEVISLCRRVKQELPEKDIWMWTGYTYAQIQNDLLRSPILSTVNYLVDGLYEHDNPTTKPFRGSGNQIIHKLEQGVSVHQS
jgi:anaerobic ribonucleoside-triphosphate reductase activating protein